MDKDPSFYRPYRTEGSEGGAGNGEYLQSPLLQSTYTWNHNPSEKVIGNAKDVPPHRLCCKPHDRLMQKGASGAPQCLPSALLMQLLISPALQDLYLPSNQPCDPCQTTDSSYIFHREFQKLQL